ncbi:hypothetical protein FGF66_04920 [Chlorobaculum thiosulfatiphilum]|uniref:Uncharacterized protein n=2 Tax=Chlorobaculum thiosulfatiphilum TaxID=115852 RepID=A0A5C4S7R8_CHLTI|nr:hypothetical protein FGF66_04920 [Chlorobaculum thiosulfatiphilum]
MEARAYRALQDIGLISDAAVPLGTNIEIEVIRDHQHARRQKLTEGPLFLYKSEEDDDSKLILEDLTILILSDSRDVRIAVIESIEKMLLKNPLILTSKSFGLLKASRNAISSPNPENWRPKAILVYDTLNDDILFSLSGIRQSLQNEPVIQDALKFYAPKVIHPSVISCDSISLSIGNPERDHGTLKTLLSDIVNSSSSLTELCSSYLEKMGFLPFAPSYSMATAVKNLVSSKNYSIDVWQDVWKWVDFQNTSLSRYHACSVFVLFPEFIPDGKLPNLWEQILTVVQNSDKKNESSPEFSPWALRRDLALHYTYHLEARLPENDGGSIGYFAWWFSEQVAALFPPDILSAKFCREKWVKPALEFSSLSWLAASAPIQRSFLRQITLCVNSPWAASLLTMMGEHMNELVPTDLAEDSRNRFQDALVFNTFSVLPFSIKITDDPTFALEGSLADTILKWAEYQPEEHKKGLQQLVEMSDTLGSSEGLLDAIKKLGEFDLPKQVVVCFALKRKLLIDQTLTEGIWEIISDFKWRKNVLGNIDYHIQASLIDSLCTLLIENGDKWYSYLPHFIAELCEKEETDEHRRVLFLYVIHTSLASDTVSAVRRLLRGEHKAKFMEYVKEYQDRVETIRYDYPPWVAGKLRGLMASLHVI